MSTSLSRLHDVFDLAMRIGELMISNGAAAADVTATMLRVTASSGIRNVSVQVTLTQVSVSYLSDHESTPFTRIRAADGYVQDFAKLDACDAITNAYVQGRIDLTEARNALERVAKGKPLYSSVLTNVGWFVMGAACAVYFGAGALVMFVAGLTAWLLNVIIVWLSRWRLPFFYVQIVGAFFCVLMAVVVTAIDPSANASLVVVACIVMLLAGQTSVGAMQDAITGWYVTAAARLLETFMLTIAVVIGIRGGMLFAGVLGADISVTASLPSTLLPLLVITVASAVMGLGFAVGIQVPVRLLPWAVLLTAGSAAGSFALGSLGLERPWAVGLTAAGVGIISVIIADRVKTPAVILVVAGLIPMVPGSIIYRGLMALGDESGSGIEYLFLAAQVAIAISAGAILGQFLAGKILVLVERGSSRIPVIASPFSTNRRRRVVTFGRTKRPALTTTAIPVVHLDPDELDPEIDIEEGPAWREDLENLRPSEPQDSGFEVQEGRNIDTLTGTIPALTTTETGSIRVVE